MNYTIISSVSLYGESKLEIKADNYGFISIAEAEQFGLLASSDLFFRLPTLHPFRWISPKGVEELNEA